jgi:putative salt-induced outer membrane protein YdiY
MPHPPRPGLCQCLLGLVIAGLGIPIAQGADEVRFKNGDRLTGTVVEQTAEFIRFRHATLGEVRIATAEASVVELPDTPAESLAGLPPQTESAPPSPPARPITPPGTKPAPRATAAARPDPSRWRGKIEFGFKQESGATDSVDFSLRGDTERKIGRNQYRATGRLLYGEKNDRKSADRYDASFRWRRDFEGDFFSQALTTYLSDQIKAIDGSYEQNIGVGYRVINRDRHIVNAGVGATGQYRQAIGADPNVQLLAEFFEDYTYKINGRFTLTQNSLVQWSDEETGPVAAGRQNYKLQFDAALQGKFTDRLSLNLRFEHEFDNSVVKRDARSDQRITSSLGYAF